MVNRAKDLKIIQRGAHLGAEIFGIDLRKSVDSETFQVINKAFVEHELLIFYNQPISSDQLIEFAQNFGQLSVHPFSPNSDDCILYTSPSKRDRQKSRMTS